MLRIRPDLIVRRRSVAGRDHWLVKDPIAARYFLLSPQEYYLLSVLGDGLPIDAIQAKFHDKFPELNVSAPQLADAVTTLHRRGLILSDGGSQAGVLQRREEDRRRSRRFDWLVNPLAIRLPGVDPGRFLSWLDARLGRLLQSWVLGGLLLFAAAALLNLGTTYDRWSDAVLRFDDFWTPQNLVISIICIVVVKAVHELAHGLTCTHFGGRCGEIGVMLFAFAPSLYCDVSDSWMIADRGRRIAIAAAGMIAEFLIAGAAALTLALSASVEVRHFCYILIVTCAISTVILNLNPLMRLDGYYILSDFVDIPNLSRVGAEQWSKLRRHIFFGLTAKRADWNRRRLLLAAYGAASSVYRTLLMLFVVFALMRVCVLMRLPTLAWLLAGVVLFGFLRGPTATVARWRRQPGALSHMSFRRSIRPVSLVIVLAAALLIPFRSGIRAPLVVEPIAAVHLIAVRAGRMEPAEVTYGDRVSEGQLVARLVDLEAQENLVRTDGEAKRQQARVNALRLRRNVDPDGAAILAEAEEMLIEWKRRRDQLEQEFRRLELTSSTAGVLLPPPPRRPEFNSSQRLPKWQEHPLDPDNRGAWIEPGTTIATVADPDRLQITIVVTQEDLPLLRIGDLIDLRLEGRAGEDLSCRVDRIALSELNDVPEQLLPRYGGDLTTKPSESAGSVRPAMPSYGVYATLEMPNAHSLIGGRGTAYVHTQPQSLLRRALRRLDGLFRFQLGDNAAE